MITESLKEYLTNNSSTLSQRHCRTLGGNTSDFLSNCSQHPTFLFQAPHPTHTNAPALSPQPAVLATFALCFYSIFQAVTKKKFGSTDFRSELENGMLLCE